VKNQEILRAARAMLYQHGANAETHIAKRADAMCEAGDLDGCRLWLKILNALKDPEIAEASAP